MEISHRRFREEEHRENVRAKSFLDLFLGDLLDRILRMLLSRVVHENVDLAELVDCLIDRFPAEFFVAIVAVDQQTFPAVLFDETRGFLRVFVFFEINHRRVRAFLGDGDRATDPTVPAGNKRHFATQFPAAAMDFLDVPPTISRTTDFPPRHYEVQKISKKLVNGVDRSPIRGSLFIPLEAGLL